MAQGKKNMNKKPAAKKAPKWNTTGKTVSASKAAAKPKEMEMFLMMKEQVNANDVFTALKEAGMTGLDVWEAMGVFAIEAREGDGVDFEQISIADTFVDASDCSFIKNRGIQTIFSFLATDNQIEALKPYFQKITELFGGFVCTDSDDFQPMIEL